MIKYFFRLFLIGLLLSGNVISHAQELIFDHGEVEFYTSSILSDIEATSEDIDVTLNLESREVDIRIPIESFEFEYEMMQDHFNEEYLESDKYPLAIFSGIIDKDLTDQSESMEVNVTGDLTIHGITKPASFQATISKSDEFTIVKCKFKIVFKDFNVKEPSVLTKKLAKDVELKSTLYLK